MKIVITVSSGSADSSLKFFERHFKKFTVEEIERNKRCALVVSLKNITKEKTKIKIGLKIKIGTQLSFFSVEYHDCNSTTLIAHQKESNRHM